MLQTTVLAASSRTRRFTNVLTYLLAYLLTFLLICLQKTGETEKQNLFAEGEGSQGPLPPA